MRQLLSPRVQQEIAGYATGLTLLGSVIGVLVIVGGLELPEQAKNAVNAMATALILIMAYMARSYVVHQPSKSYAHLMQIFEDEKHAWEIHAVVGKIVPIPEKDPEYLEAVKPFNLQNKHAYMVKYSNVTVIGDQSFEGQKFDFTMALMFSEVPTGELYGEGISHEILYRNFPAPVRCAFLTVDMLRLHKVPRVKGVTDEDWIPVFFVRHGPYYSEAQRKFKELPAASTQLMAATELVRKLVLIQIDGKIIEREQEAREKGIGIGRKEGEATVRDFEAGLDRGIQVPRFRAHPKLTVFIIGIVATAILAYWIGWLRV